MTAGGKNGWPAILEDRLGRPPLINQVPVVGDRLPCRCALIPLTTDTRRAACKLPP